MTLGLRTKLFLISLALVVVSAVGAYAYLDAYLERTLTTAATEAATAYAEVAAARASALAQTGSERDSWGELAGELARRFGGRVTLVGLDGRALGDSELPLEALPRLMNDPSRPELQAALRGERGRRFRIATQDGPPVLFVAVPVRRGNELLGAARFASSLEEVVEARRNVRGMIAVASLIALLVALAMSAIATELSSRAVRALSTAARKMAEGDLSVRTRLTGHDELSELGRALDRLAQSLSATVGELQNQLNRLSGILTGMEEGVLVLDQDGRVALINPALREMLLLPADSVGKSLLELVRHAELKELLDAARRRGPVAREIDLAGLKPRRLQVRAAQLQTEGGGVFAVFVDVTEMRRLETMRRDFVANVSHELRTPVTAIRSAAETLAMAIARDPGSAETFVHIIDRNAERLHGLVEDLLDLSRIESREYRLNLEELDLQQVFDQVLSLFRERAAKREVTVRDELPQDVPQARADRRALEHVLTNLVDNAVKYSGAGSEVRLTARSEGSMIRVEVSDDGAGIDADHLPRLFERFYRVDTGRSRSVGGTGLGLSIVKHLVESMGGQVSVESQPGHGTAFRFTLPRAEE